MTTDHSLKLRSSSTRVSADSRLQSGGRDSCDSNQYCILEAGMRLDKSGSMNQNFGSKGSTGALKTCGSVVLWLSHEATHLETLLADDHEQLQLALYQQPQTATDAEP